MSRNEVSASVRDRIRGALYGAAIGDAMGATTEFMTSSDIRATFPSGQVCNIIGGGAFGWERGEVTDDTQMSFCVMRAVMEAEQDGEIDKMKFLTAVMREFVGWYDSNPKDIGNACAIGIRSIKEAGTVVDSSQAFGNGGLMRALPLALINEPGLNVIQNDLTHSNELCHKALADHHKMVQYYLEHGSSYMGPVEVRYQAPMEPTGHVTNTLNNAVYYANVCCTFTDAILLPVNSGGDSDTIACIAGGMAGAKWGFQFGIPHRWIRQLLPEVREKLNQYTDWACGYLERKAARKTR